MAHKKLIPPLLIGGLLYFLPHPPEITDQAWKLFAIFVGTIIGLITRPFATGIVTIIALTLTMLLGILDIKQQAFVGFSSPTIWLIGSVFFIARGVIHSRLGERIAYWLIYQFGEKTLGLGYAITITELLFASVIPSSTARSGGIVMPIITSINHALGSHPKDHTEDKIGSYLVQCGYHTNIVSSTIFLTGMVSNALCQGIAQSSGIFFTWTDWFYAACVPGIISIFLMPLLLFKLSKPSLTYLPESKGLALEKLRLLGPISKNEIKMIVVFFTLLTLWIDIFGFGLDATTVAFIGLSLTILFDVVSFDEMIKEKNAWHTMIWLGILITFSRHLETFGFINYVTQAIYSYIRDVSWIVSYIGLILSYFFAGYLFAGNSAHASALYAGFLTLLIDKGSPPLISSLILAFMSSLFGSLTHYGSSTGGIYFALNYVKLSTWWKNGFIVSCANLLIWLGIGSIWWKTMGLI